MSRKHYEMIARAIRAEVATLPAYSEGHETQRKMAEAIAIELAQDNPRFDRARFLRACGF